MVLTIALAAGLAAPPALAFGGGDPPAGPTARQLFNDGKKAIDAKRWARAITLMSQVVAKQPRNASAHNYLGFAHRKLGDLDKAAGFYKVALRLDPKHRGALEYQGELYLKLGRLADAWTNLARLERLCPSGCEALADLRRAIADFTAAKGRQSGS